MCLYLKKSVVIFRDVKNENSEEKKTENPVIYVYRSQSGGDWCILPIDQTIIISKTNLTYGPQWAKNFKTGQKTREMELINFTDFFWVDIFHFLKLKL